MMFTTKDWSIFMISKVVLQTISDLFLTVIEHLKSLTSYMLKSSTDANGSYAIQNNACQIVGWKPKAAVSVPSL